MARRPPRRASNDPTAPELAAEPTLSSEVQPHGDYVEHSFRDIEFAGADLSHWRFVRCGFERVHLTVDFHEAGMTRVEFRNRRMVGAIRGVTVGIDQLVPYALGVFAETGVRVSSDEQSDNPSESESIES